MKKRLEKLASYSEHLLDAFLGLKQKFIVFWTMVENKEIQLKYGGGDKARGFSVLRFALYSSCALDVIKLTIDKGPRTPCVKNIMTILTDARIRSELRNRYSEYRLPRKRGSKHIEEELVKVERKEQTIRAGNFDQILTDLENAWDEFNGQPWVTGLRDLRDKNTAHLEIRETSDGYKPVAVESLGLKWNDLSEAIKRLEELVLKVNLIARDAGGAIEDAGEQFDRTSRDFWR